MTRDEQMRAAIEARGLKIIRQGTAFRVLGPGTDLLVATLGNLTPADLAPATGPIFQQPPKGRP